MKSSSHLPKNPNLGVLYNEQELRDIWFAGGCFWGVQAYFDRVYGVASTSVGYANGKNDAPTYEELGNSGHAETVHIRYDPNKVSLKQLIERLFTVIDPTSVNRQGGDIGEQYRTGIYYRNREDKETILSAIYTEQAKHIAPIATQILPLAHYYLAEEYHQSYLEKNPNGYCHINLSEINKQTP